jgi:hypothetical protein
LIIPVIACFDLITYALFFNLRYDFVFLTGLCFWAICLLATNQLKQFSEKLSREVILNTLTLFFILNAALSLINLLSIIAETGSLNPFQYQGLYQKYFIGTGDYIRGISLDTSNTNAFINAFGILYFLRNEKYSMTLLCMCILLLTGSNLANSLLIISLIYFALNSSREQKSIISICLFLFILFIAKISPQNQEYAMGIVEKFLPKENTAIAAASLPASEEQRKQYAKNAINSEYTILQKEGLLANIIATSPGPKPIIPMPDINGPVYQSKNDSGTQRLILINYSRQNHLDTIFSSVKDSWQKKSGKLISFQQTVAYFKTHHWQIPTGTGMGQFSSKLAFRSTALNIAGGFPKECTYASKAFLSNHLAVFLYFFTKQKELHSVANTPDSVYNQLMGEYGLAGILALLIFYFGYFLKGRDLRITIPYIILLSGAFAFGYWFEQLSIVPLFELLLFSNKNSL